MRASLTQPVLLLLLQIRTQPDVMLRVETPHLYDLVALAAVALFIHAPRDQNCAKASESSCN
jgi:hypothetical protein